MRTLVFKFPLIAPTINHATKSRAIKRGNVWTSMNYATATTKKFLETATTYIEKQLEEQELADKDLSNCYLHSRIHIVGSGVLTKDGSRVNRRWGDVDNLVKYTNDPIFTALKAAGYNVDDAQVMTPVPTKHDSKDGTIGTLVILSIYDTLGDYYLFTQIPRHESYSTLTKQYNELKGSGYEQY